MRILLQRSKSNQNETLGRFYVNGELICYSLEDEKREVKVIGETRIPAGIYKIKARTVGGHHARYLKKFPDFHKGMLWLQDVPKFQYILIHIGNDDDDTAGCLLTGTTYSETKGNITVQRSTEAYIKLYKMVLPSLLAGDLEIEVRDEVNA